MPSFVVVGASRGLGYAWLELLSKDPENIVIGTARNPESTIERVKKDGLERVTILQADLSDITSLKRSVSEVSQLTGGSLDYLIVNGAYLSSVALNRFLDDFESEPELLQRDLDSYWTTNVVGVINAINAFLPLLRKGTFKKVVAISTGMADPDLITEYDLWESAPYSITKAAMNVAIAKYAARYGKSDGILFLALSPGVVETQASSEKYELFKRL